MSDKNDKLFSTDETFVASKGNIQQELEQDYEKFFRLTPSQQKEMNEIYEEIESGSTHLIFEDEKKKKEKAKEVKGCEIEDVDIFLTQFPEYVGFNAT